MLQRTPAMRVWLIITGSALGVFLLAPVLWLTRTALTPDQQMFDTHFHLIPSHFTLANFTFALRHSDLTRYLVNSLVSAGGAAVLSTALGTYAAYGLVTFRFRLARTIMVVFLLAQVFPVALILVRLYPLLLQFGLTDSRIGLMLAYVVLSLPAALYIMHSFLLRFPPELIEAARIDGCGEFRVFHRIVLPVIKPGLVAVWLFSFMWGWNDLLFSLTLVSDNALKTLGPGLLSTYLGQFRDDWGGIMAASILASLPVVVLFMVFQRSFIRGIMAGAVKG